jgi:hypothetical protein
MAIKALEQQQIIPPSQGLIRKESLLAKLDPCYKQKIKVAPDNMAEGFIQVEKLINQEYVIPYCDDCVSRAEVFEIMGNLMSIPYDFDRPINEDDVSESMDRIKALPPVTPTKCIATVKFSKEDLRDICNERIESTHGTCKDCRWLTTDEDGNYYCEQTGYFDSLDFYCKDFERRGDENEAD